jgi:uncharacterized oligopeptide transporter (OPT) family protein
MLTILVLLVAGCRGRGPESAPNPDNPAMLQVENRGFADMVIYAVSGAQRVRLGIATGNSMKSFSIPAALTRGAGPLRFLADPIGGSRTPISEDIIVQPGDIVSLTIPP